MSIILMTQVVVNLGVTKRVYEQWCMKNDIVQKDMKDLEVSDVEQILKKDTGMLYGNAAQWTRLGDLDCSQCWSKQSSKDIVIYCYNCRWSYGTKYIAQTMLYPAG